MRGEGGKHDESNANGVAASSNEIGNLTNQPHRGCATA